MGVDFRGSSAGRAHAHICKANPPRAMLPHWNACRPAGLAGQRQPQDRGQQARAGRGPYAGQVLARECACHMGAGVCLFWKAQGLAKLHVAHRLISIPQQQQWSSGSSIIWSCPNGNSAAPAPAPAPVVDAGLTAENVAEKFHVERKVQDRCAAASHAKAAAAQVQGRLPGWLWFPSCWLVWSPIVMQAVHRSSRLHLLQWPLLRGPAQSAGLFLEGQLPPPVHRPLASLTRRLCRSRWHRRMPPVGAAGLLADAAVWQSRQQRCMLPC